MTISPLSVPPGLGILAVKILVILAESGEADTSTIAARSGVSGPCISAAVWRLEQRGFVRRRPKPGDRRVQLFRLSAEGTRLLSTFAAQPDILPA